MQQKVGTARRSGRPTSAEAGQLYELIVQAAFEVFVRTGFGGASVEQIVQQSGATRRSVLYRFPDKEALLLAVVESRMRRLVAGVIEPDAMVSARPVDALRDTCRLMYEGVLDPEHVDFYRVCVAEVAKFPTISSGFIAFNDRLAADLEDLVTRAQRTGAFEGVLARSLATNLIAVFISNPLNRFTLGDRQFALSDSKQRYFNEMWTLLSTHALGMPAAHRR